MRARHWTMTAIGGLAGFAAVALCIVYAMTRKKPKFIAVPIEIVSSENHWKIPFKRSKKGY